VFVGPYREGKIRWVQAQGYVNGYHGTICVTNVRRDLDRRKSWGRGKGWPLKAQFSFSLPHHLDCERSLSSSKIHGEESKRTSATHDCERHVRATMPRAASSADIGRRLLAARGIAIRRSHVTLTVTLARLLVLRSFPRFSVWCAWGRTHEGCVQYRKTLSLFFSHVDLFSAYNSAQ